MSDKITLIPDPAKTVEPVKDKDSKVDPVATRAAEKAARKAAWKRESKKADRTKAKAERIAAWEDATGMKWGEA